jgi:hypothetical protein
MKTNRIIMTLCLIVLLRGAGMAQMVTNTWLSGNGNHWTNAANWSLGSVPESTQQALVPGPYTGGDIIIDGPAFAYNFYLNAGTYAVNITNGGVLTVYQTGNSIYTTGTGYRTFNVFADSALVDAAAKGAGNYVRAFLNIYSSATVTGFDDFRTGSKVTLEGGTWTPATLAVAGSIAMNTAAVELNAGTLYLGLFGDGSVRYFNIIAAAAGPTLDFTGGNIVLVPQNGYVPKAGHSYTLWVDGGTGTTFLPGTGQNISVQGYPEVSFDLSQWASSGTLVVRNSGTLVTVR